jgi:hypothetical protein
MLIIDSTGPSSTDAPMRPCYLARTVVVQLPSGVKERSWIVRSVMILPGNDREYGWITATPVAQSTLIRSLTLPMEPISRFEVLYWTVIVDTSLFFSIFFFKVLAIFTIHRVQYAVLYRGTPYKIQCSTFFPPGRNRGSAIPSRLALRPR